MTNLKENEIITLTAEDGSEIELEHMATVTYKGHTYGAFYPIPEENEDILDADYDMVILEMSEADGEQIFDLIEDSPVREALEDIFMETIFGE